MAEKRSKKHKKINRWIGGEGKKQGAIRHPGALRKAAKAHGRSTLQEAEVEKNSPDKSIASRGRLALRFMGHAKHGNIGKHVGPRKKHRSKIVRSK